MVDALGEGIYEHARSRRFKVVALAIALIQHLIPQSAAWVLMLYHACAKLLQCGNYFRTRRMIRQGRSPAHPPAPCRTNRQRGPKNSRMPLSFCRPSSVLWLHPSRGRKGRSSHHRYEQTFLSCYLVRSLRIANMTDAVKTLHTIRISARILSAQPVVKLSFERPTTTASLVQ